MFFSAGKIQILWFWTTFRNSTVTQLEVYSTRSSEIFILHESIVEKFLFRKIGGLWVGTLSTFDTRGEVSWQTRLFIYLLNDLSGWKSMKEFNLLLLITQNFFHEIRCGLFVFSADNSITIDPMWKIDVLSWREKNLLQIWFENLFLPK